MSAVEVPYLNDQAVATEAQRLFAKRKRALLAMYGRGESQVITVDNADVPVIPVRSELELRAQLPPLEDGSKHVFLLPWPGILPDDLAGRFVLDGRIARVDRSTQLAALFRATSATPEAAKTALAEFLLKPGGTKPRLATGGLLTPQTLYESWLSDRWEVPTEGGIAADTLLAWSAKNRHGEQFRSLVKAQAPAGLHDELNAQLVERAGPIARVIWHAWESNHGLSLLALSILCETLAPLPNDVIALWLRQKLRTIAPTAKNDAEVTAWCKQLGQLVRPALAWLTREAEALVPRALEDAEKLVDDDHVRAQLIGNTRLKLAWDLRLEALSNALVTAATHPSHKSLAAVSEAWHRLERHDLFFDEKTDSFVKTAEMAARLAGWLVVHTVNPPEHALASYGDAETLATWYAQDGGFVDHARRRARALQTGPLKLGAQAVVCAVDEAREKLDVRFAAGLEQWVNSQRPAKQILPIDAALKRIAVPFLEQASDRSLLVLLMDGMAWAQAIELLPSLAQKGRRWGPLTWSQLGGNKIGSGEYPALIAALPTITEVSRAAFFSGRVPKTGEKLDTAKDNERFASNKALHPFCDPSFPPKLLLRNDGHTADGGLTPDALQLIANTTERRIVGIVVNAIDASLKGDSQHEKHWDIESIRSLPSIFDAARDAGRAVLMVADHGHVPADRLKPLGAGDSGGARWRVWRGPTDALQAGERKFSGDGVHVRAGTEGVVLIETDALRYGGGAHAGEHGGAALAEVVAPCVLLGYDDELRVHQDPALKVRGLYVPDWWSQALPDAALHLYGDPAPLPKAKPKKAQVSDAQLGFGGAFAEPSPDPPRASGISAPPVSGPAAALLRAEDLLPALWGNALFKTRGADKTTREKGVRAVHFLLQRSGAAPDQAFASHLGEPPYRVGGIISKLQELLNVDGYEILRYDRLNKQVFLDKVKLEQQFEVKL